jgi:predicted TIM-barrel fold metal-dependent hydrolase
MVNGKAGLVERYLRRFPRLAVIVDHCGMPWQGGDAEALDEVLALAAYPNAALKWSHAQDIFGVTDYPYDGLSPFLRRAIDAFGAERIMWASDHTSIKGQSWAELLFCLRDSPHLSQVEKELILGGTVRRVLAWPKAPAR